MHAPCPDTHDVNSKQPSSFTERTNQRNKRQRHVVTVTVLAVELACIADLRLQAFAIPNWSDCPGQQGSVLSARFWKVP